MWSRGPRLFAGLAALVLAVSPVAAAAGGSDVEITDERRKICAKAEARFQKVYPDYKVEPGVTIVKLYKYNFCPANLSIKKGTKVRWLNVDRRTSHSVWMKDAGIAESERFFPEEMFEYTFQASGPYPYLCGPHWKDESMVGFVKVTD